jgi:hypothetical protein
MAPVDFEKELQDRLRSREIQPRKDSWDRIEARLQTQKSNTKGSPVVWKILAAASILFLFGYFLWPETARELPQIDAVVQSPDTDSSNGPGPSQKTVNQTGPEEPVPTGTVLAETEPQAKENGGDSANNIPVQGRSESLLTAELSDQALAQVTLEVAQVIESDQGGVTSFNANEELQTGVDESEIDALLNQALQVVKNRSNTKDTTALNPAILLGEVESELDETFREQILKKLKMGFNKVRTGVAERSQ